MPSTATAGPTEREAPCTALLPREHTIRTLSPTRRLRTTAGAGITTLALVGGLAACGDVDAQLEARKAVDNLKASKTASFTISLDDPDAELASLAEAEGDREVADRVTAASLRVVVDPAGDQSIGEASATPASDPTDIVAALKASGAFEIAYVDGGSDVVVMRMVDGVLAAKVDLPKIEEIAGEPLPLDELETPDAPPGVADAVQGVRDGKWLTLDFAAVYERLEALGLGDAMEQQQSIDPGLATSFAKDLLGAVQANSVSTEKVGEDEQVVVDVSVKAKAALLATLDVLDDPKYAALLQGGQAAGGASVTQGLELMRSEIEKLPDSPVTGQILIEDESVEQLSLDLASAVALGTDEKAKSTIKTARVVVDVDDEADAVTVPAAEESVDVNALVDMALAGLGGAVQPS